MVYTILKIQSLKKKIQSGNVAFLGNHFHLANPILIQSSSMSLVKTCNNLLWLHYLLHFRFDIGKGEIFPTSNIYLSLFISFFLLLPFSFLFSFPLYTLLVSVIFPFESHLINQIYSKSFKNTYFSPASEASKVVY